MEPPGLAVLPLAADLPDQARQAPSEWQPWFLEGEGLQPEVASTRKSVYLITFPALAAGLPDGMDRGGLRCPSQLTREEIHECLAQVCSMSRLPVDCRFSTHRAKLRSRVDGFVGEFDHNSKSAPAASHCKLKAVYVNFKFS